MISTGTRIRKKTLEFQLNDWRPNHRSSEPIYEKVNSRIKSDNPYAIHWISLFLKEYLFGEWNNEIPKLQHWEDGSALSIGLEEACHFHKFHKKFGENIIECGFYHLPDLFVFFEHKYVKLSIECLVSDKDGEIFIPTIKAKSQDRIDFEEFE